ncbi:MAG: lipopolysaccharide biosynthesis protein [Parvularculaceae bacterium]
MDRLDRGVLRRAVRAVGEMGAEKAFRKRVGNIGHLMAGNFGAGVISFFAVALAARALGVETFGVLALVSTFIQAIERFVSFQTWQPIIRYGAALKDEGRDGDLKSLIKLGFLLDVAAAIAGFLLAVSLAMVGAARFDWAPEIVNSLVLYSAALLVLITGSPTGVMRLAGRFREIAYFQVVAMTVRCALCVAALWLELGLFAFVAIWAATHVLGALLLMATSIRELKRLDCADFLKAPLSGLSVRFPNIWRFSILANLSLTVRSSAQQLDTLIVGALAGAGGAGLYHIAKRIAKFAQSAGQQVQAVVFPDIAKLWAKGDTAHFRKDVARTEGLLLVLCALGVGATFLLAGPVIDLFAGADYDAAGEMLKVQIIAVAALIAGSVTRTALLCMGRETTVFALSVASTAIFFAAAFALIPRMGAIGANYAHAAAGVFIVIALWTAYRLALKSGAAPKPADTLMPPPSGHDDGF